MSNEQNYFPKSPPLLITDLVVQSNQITLAKYSLNLVEKRMLYIIIDKVRKKFVEKKEDTETQVDLFGNMTIQFKPSDLKELDNITRMYTLLSDFKSKSIQINTDDIWITVGLVNYVKHKKKENIIEIEVSKELVPHLVELSEKFTAYSFTVAISFKSIYTQRFYELCQMWRSSGYFFYTLDELREILDSENTYKLYADFRRNVLDKAQKELYESFISNEAPKAEIFFKYGVKSKKGVKKNQVNEIEFFIYDTDNDLFGNWQIPDYKYNIRILIAPYIKNDAKYVSRVLDSITSLEIANKMYVRLLDKKKYYVESQKTEMEIAKIFRTILKEDFNIK